MPSWARIRATIARMRSGLFLALAAIAAAVGGVSGAFLMPGYGSESWPTTPGTVVQCDVEKHRDDEDGVRYVAKLRYRYQVGEGTFHRFRIDYWRTRVGFRYRRDAEARCAEYPIDAPLTVYYRPDLPLESTLIPGGLAWAPFLTYGSGVLTVLLLLLSMASTVLDTVRARQERARLRRELGVDD